MNLLIFLIIIETTAQTHRSTGNISGHGEIGNYPKMNMKLCGLLTMTTSRIVAGELANEGEFPWMAAIYDKSLNDLFLCGGTLINTFWILTAGHCVYNKSVNNLKINMGSLLLNETYQSFDVFNYYLHPHIDLALIRVNKEIIPVHKFNYYLINGVCLPKERIINTQHEDALVSGFGHADTNAADNNYRLRKTQILIDPYFDCFKEGYKEFHICGTESVHMLCFGDSGSALIQLDGNRAVVIGIAAGGKSWTPEKCGPGIVYFFRVSYFIDWIRYYIENNITTGVETTTIETTGVKPDNPNPQTTTQTSETTKTPTEGESNSGNSYTHFWINFLISLNFIVFVFKTCFE